MLLLDIPLFGLSEKHDKIENFFYSEAVSGNGGPGGQQIMESTLMSINLSISGPVELECPNCRVKVRVEASLWSRSLQVSPLGHNNTATVKLP